MKPKFQIGTTVVGPSVCGWVKQIFQSEDGKEFVYAIIDAETDFEFLEREEDLQGV